MDSVACKINTYKCCQYFKKLQVEIEILDEGAECIEQSERELRN